MPLAVLSPQISVEMNVRYMLYAMMTGNTPDGLARTIRLSYEHYLRTGEIRGPKTKRFNAAIMGDQDAVVLDAHMGYALNVPATKLRNKAIQVEAEKRVGWAANLLGRCPRDTQAMIWSGQRARSGWVSTGDVNPTRAQRYLSL